MSGIDSLLSNTGAVASRRRAQTHPVLVVEDSDEDFDTIVTAAMLAGIQQEMRRAMTGDDCLAFLKGDAGQPKAQVALVLLDLNTPQGDGRSALEAIHADAQLCAIPLVVLSTSASPRDVDFCYGHGANAYHVKRVNHGENLRVLQTVLSYWLGTVVLPTEQSLER